MYEHAKDRSQSHSANNEPLKNGRLVNQRASRGTKSSGLGEGRHGGQLKGTALPEKKKEYYTTKEEVYIGGFHGK